MAYAKITFLITTKTKNKYTANLRETKKFIIYKIVLIL